MIVQIISNDDINRLIKDSIWNLVRTIVFKDPESALQLGENIKEFVFQTPTLIFWDKMERFLKGCFTSFEDQVKLSEKFNNDNKKFYDYVYKQVNIINKIESDEKVDYIANLTRCFLLFDMDTPLYFRLTKFIEDCTSEELMYIKSIDLDSKLNNNAIISMLILQGLFMQVRSSDDKAYYALTPFGKTLKICSLNFGEEQAKPIKASLKYKELECIPQLEFI